MKALIVTSVYGFLSKFERQNVRLLQEMGFEVHYASNHDNVVYKTDHDEMQEMGVIFHNIPISQSPLAIATNRKAAFKLKQIITEENIDIVHCHTPTGGMVARLACRNLDVYMIYTAHGFHFYKGARPIHNLIYYSAEDLMSRWTDCIVTINHEDENAAKTMHASKVYRIPGVGIDSDYYRLTYDTDRDRAREKLGIEPDVFFMISVGELRENKNQMIILKTLARIRKKMAEDEAKRKLKPGTLKIKYGLIGSGRQEDEMREYVEKNDLSDMVCFYGYKSDIRVYLAAADVMVFPSIREGLGMAALEALSTGLPVIASENRGSKEYIIDRRNGLLVSEDSTKAYSKAVLEAMLREQDSNDLSRRENIRESVSGFSRSETEKIMRKVYEDARDKCSITSV
jgi:glycosyltransferase EpsD